MFGSAGYAGVDCVDIQLIVINNVTRHHGSLEEMCMFEMLCQNSRIVQILEGRVAIFVVFHIHNVNCRTGCAVMNTLR